MSPITFRLLHEEETGKIKEIDRSEEIWENYVFHEGRISLVLHRETVYQFDPAELDIIIARQKTILQEKGAVLGAFDNDKLIGVASLERKRRGSQRSSCKMDILYVSKGYRNRRTGQMLLEEIKRIGKEFGAEQLYISATPTKNTVDFYLRHNAMLATEIDPELYSMEPEDIHLELML